MLKIDLRPGERVKIGGVAIVTLEQKSGSRARLSIEADSDVKVEKAGRVDTSSHAAKYGITNKPK